MSAVIERKGIAMFVGSAIAGQAFLKASQRIVSLLSRSANSGRTLIGFVMAVAFLVSLGAPSEATRVRALEPFPTKRTGQFSHPRTRPGDLHTYRPGREDGVDGLRHRR